MPRYIALLRGVNVGGHNRLPMADLRAALADDGLQGVRTYIQSGNVVFDAARQPAVRLASRIHDSIAVTFGLDVATIVIEAPELASVVERTPYGHEPDPKRVHAVFLPGPVGDAARMRLQTLQEASRAKGSRDSLTIDGSVVYLHTPDGFGTSDLATSVTTRGRTDALDGTARNWSTVTALLELSRVDPT